ncbi:hypothetical protein Kpol_1064p43 [Vanderwaltozyma polyspora DSM 70294]|uniref:Tetrapyrrole biosynthesis uroporphyrinogen III synthase domain-containing protein n=1 Tax=Vanderwaltozyma polyspora (strain ATCC 22028 / DSM 70294 / BCRC 21397 / CBS 2163 / NBRC 10782 / NRRL Y-8283 / UCD 57-17) TaxID=436907 RepID=A7TMG7_VANPO|nr:uncharacterized protein Kpol_1064p43 [Vanderwaltozyma polyspora DSM 70294]EDO16561.1 hypothetical protein Kpol_1064p43 [Vanderwaltozyma polyspora DSM 70294]
MSNRVILLKNKTSKLDSYENLFKQHQYDPVFLPLIKHQHIPDEAFQVLNSLEYLVNLKYIIITSQRTVECLMETILPNLCDDHKRLLLSKTVYTVGPATAGFLERIGFVNIKGGDRAGNGSILADVMIDELSVDQDICLQQEILFLVGEIRRDIIPTKLSSAGFNIREIVTYKTCPLEDNLTRFQDALKPGSWVVLFSPQGTKDILDFLKQHPHLKCNVATIGPTTEKYMLDQGVKPNVVSPKPDCLSLLHSIMP